jgi:hypothetical protein
MVPTDPLPNLSFTAESSGADGSFGSGSAGMAVIPAKIAMTAGLLEVVAVRTAEC